MSELPNHADIMQIWSPGIRIATARPDGTDPSRRSSRVASRSIRSAGRATAGIQS